MKKKYGRLIVTGSRVGPKPYYRRFFSVVCECGTKKEIEAHAVKSGLVKSCGCLAVEKARVLNFRHGGCGTPEYNSWTAMRQRCNNPNTNSYKNYGARGIKVCERWNTFAQFFADMGQKPSERHSLDRINVYGDYEPSNCRWATPEEQARNQRVCKCPCYCGARTVTA